MIVILLVSFQSKFIALHKNDAQKLAQFKHFRLLCSRINFDRHNNPMPLAQ